MAGQGVPDAERCRVTSERVRAGRLELTAAPVGNGGNEGQTPGPQVRGILAAAAALSAETCEICSGKGDPIAAADGTPVGTRCSQCRKPATRTIARNWPTGEPEADEEKKFDPTKRLEERHDNYIQRLMRADDDHGRAMWLTTHMAGWAGIIRALFLRLRSEQDERPEDPGHHPWRLGTMKEKWGGLRLEDTAGNAYQNGVIKFLEMASQWTCAHCGRDASLRYGGWVRPECDECWTTTSAKEAGKHAEQMATLEGDKASAGFQGINIGPWGHGGPFGICLSVPLEPLAKLPGDWGWAQSSALLVNTIALDRRLDILSG